MNRHPFRWEGLAFGLFFLAILGQWAVWEQDWLEPHDLAYLAAATLILLGLLGIAATLGIVGTLGPGRRRPQQAPHTPEKTQTTEEGPTP